MIGEDDVTIVNGREGDTVSWFQLRQAMWPEIPADTHRQEIERILNSSEMAGFVAMFRGREAVGFAEASLRHDYVNGCEFSPVAFLEATYVSENYRRRGLARRLSQAVEQWAREKGCQEFASDTDLSNSPSFAFHLSLGFTETERVIFFRKLLTD